MSYLRGVSYLNFKINKLNKENIVMKYIKKISKKILSFTLIFVMLMSFIPDLKSMIYADAVNEYLDYDYSTKEFIKKRCSNYSFITSKTKWLESGWYVVSGNVETSRLDIWDYDGNENVNIILCDGCKWNARTGIRVESGQKLTIFGQTGGTGELIANGKSKEKCCGQTYAGIGSGHANGAGQSGGDIVINGGKVTACGDYGAGIGGCQNNAGGTVIINGGFVYACSRYGAGIGGGLNIGKENGKGGRTIINGGEVVAECISNVFDGVGIGAGSFAGATGKIQEHGTLEIGSGVTLYVKDDKNPNSLKILAKGYQEDVFTREKYMKAAK